MKLLIVSTAPLIYKDGSIYAYSPYVNELVILKKFSDEIIFCCPVWNEDNGLLISEIPFKIPFHFKLVDSNLKTFKSIVKSLFSSVYNCVVLFKAMKNADHIHLRCPGNVGLLGCFVQILFPNKIKSAKYAGNWDPKSKQPWTYKIQKYILNNTFLTRNIQVLVYGNWERQSKNIKSFFTATYSENEKETSIKADFKEQQQFVFVGSLTSGKNPMYALQLVEGLLKKGNKIVLNIYGEGPERVHLEKYIKDNKLEKFVFFKGNQSKEIIKKAYQESHFVILPSKSEGWPKVVAEGMFWGCVPIATKVSCVPFMIDNGKRGILLDMDINKDLLQIHELINDEKNFTAKSKLACDWSQNYTTDLFESEIKKLLIK
ncbi:glycosyltransferase [Flavobacterium sp. ov086]|uniref:glycosyltransferase n=1 Tax=Flavobacterium sp. ov086 TaxID=1761785 RepID=UPI000B76722C|nr:glycosyltransferase [Flavobacterium sp. ov086]SNR49134.1 Glycosyltransferase involved in cell wall bisynthesis [Flavobacterium sp. ov086]